MEKMRIIIQIDTMVGQRNKMNGGRGTVKGFLDKGVNMYEVEKRINQLNES